MTGVEKIAALIRESTRKVRVVGGAVNPAELPVMETGYEPAGVAPAPLVVATLITAVQVCGLPVLGVQDAGENDADAPAGRPDAEKPTGSAAPPIFVTVIVVKFCVVSPCVTAILPELARVKVKLMFTAALSVAVLPPVPVQVTE